MSSDDPTMEAKENARSPDNDDIELILEDEIDEVITIDSDQDGDRTQDTNGTKDDDDYIEIIDSHDEEKERTTLITEEMVRMEKALKEKAAKFFDPTSDTSVSNLSPDTRKDMSRYAAALFEWICCIPSPDLLAELYMGDIDLPFPVTPAQKRGLVRRDFGARLADVWRQTKSLMKMANHFKLKEQVALLSLLDHGFNNPSHDLDIYPLMKAHEISMDDYYTVASFILTNSNPRLWKTPDIMLCEAMMPPLTCSIALYLMNTECVRGAQVAIPWEELNTDLRAISENVGFEQEQALLEAFKQMAMECPIRKMHDETQKNLRAAEKAAGDMQREVRILSNQVQLKSQELQYITTHSQHLLNNRVQAIDEVKPAHFEEHGTELAKADAEIIVAEYRNPLRFNRERLQPKDVLDMTEEQVPVLARLHEDASEPFQESELIRWEDAARALVRFPNGVVQGTALTSLAPSKEKTREQMPMSAEGVRVAALANHPLRPNEPRAYYSGTIISKYDIKVEEYAIAFDDFFEDYVNIRDMRLLMKQPFNDKMEFDRSSVYSLMTPNLSASVAATEERKVFLLLFFCLYPDWGCVKMNERVGRNVSTVHRNGQGWVAQALKVDRLLVWLRFNPKQTEPDPSGAHDCLELDCKKHEHLDEKMYRGNPRLKQMNVNIQFDAAMKIYRSFTDVQMYNPQMHLHFMKEYKEKSTKQVQRHGRRQQAANGQGFEPAIPVESKYQRGQAGGPIAQTARKCGTGLQMEAAVPIEAARKFKKKEVEVKISYIDVDMLNYYNQVDTEKDNYRPDLYHEKCAEECLKGQDADPLDARFTKENLSPYMIPIMCGWRRIKQDYTFTIINENCPVGVYYRTPCGRPLNMMSDVLDYLDATRSNLTVDVFTFDSTVDETAYIAVTEEDKTVKTLDMTNGAENRPISVMNDIDDDAMPSFMYRSRRYPLSDKIEMTTIAKEFCSGCDCKDDCRDWTKCACQRLTHRESIRALHSFKNPTKGYTNRLLTEKVSTGIYECNENCGCSRKRCINRVVQNDLKIPMQMIKTKGTGWGVRTLVDVPAGTFISCYHGAVLSDIIAEVNAEGDEYFADLDFYPLAENEKMNAGIDLADDQGVFFEDVGARDLTEREIAQVEKEDELGKFRREEEIQKLIERKERREQKEMERRARVEERRERRRRQRAIQEEEEEEEEEGTEDEGDGEGEGKGEENGEGKGEDGDKLNDKRDEGRVNMNDTLDEGVLGDLDDTMDETIDEGVDEGDSQDEGSMDEEDESASSPDLVKLKEEEEQMRVKQEAARQLEEIRMKEIERQKRVKEESKTRYNIPMKNVDNDCTQIEAYFEDAACQHLFLIDAKAGGNIGRQFNHSCEPNMYTQHIFVDTHDIRLPWSAFFASRVIKAGEELCWDYGWTVNEAKPRGMKCQCGAESCKVDLL